MILKKNTFLINIDDGKLGSEIKGSENGADIITNAIKYGSESESKSTNTLAGKIEAQLEKGVDNVSKHELEMR